MLYVNHIDFAVTKLKASLLTALYSSTKLQNVCDVLSCIREMFSDQTLDPNGMGFESYQPEISHILEHNSNSSYHGIKVVSDQCGDGTD